MNPAATPLRTARCLLVALLLGAAGLCARAQLPEAASAPEALATPDAPASAAPVRRARPAVLPASAVPVTSALAPAPTWATLTPRQRALLAPLEGDWADLGASQRTKWLNATPMLARLPEPELTRLHKRMRGWSKMTPAERRDARMAFQLAKQVDAEQRQAKWEAYQALPPEKRQELAEKAAARRKARAQAAGPVPRPLAGGPKSNLVPTAPQLVAPVPVNGGVVQARPGATTVLINRSNRLPPPHQMAGQAKVVANPALVDAQTLLPRSLKAPPASSPRP